MSAMAPTGTMELHQRRVRLAREPAAAAAARGQVRVAIRDWKIPVDADIAVLLTSDLVTNAITYGEGKTVTLAIRCSVDRLRIDVYDASRALLAVDLATDPDAGPGLVLVTTLSDEWGCFRTPAGKCVYFTLAFREELPRGGDTRPQGTARGDGGL
jgi:hypothetical protein